MVIPVLELNFRRTPQCVDNRDICDLLCPASRRPRPHRRTHQARALAYGTKIAQPLQEEVLECEASQSIVTGCAIFTEVTSLKTCGIRLNRCAP